MAGNISSLGIGSGVLTADVIDQLRAADESSLIKPITTNIDLTKQKQEAYSLLTSLMTTFKASASALSYDTIFEGKTVSLSGEGNSQVSIDDGYNVEPFTLETINLAKKDITKLGAVADRDTTKVASSSGTLTIGKGDQSFEVSYNATMTLQDLAQAITDAGGETFSASILRSGEDAFNLMITSKETGSENALTITDTSGNLSAALFSAKGDANPNGYEKVQTGSDAKFKYNGIEITRSSNTFSDLISGVNITLGDKLNEVTNVGISLDKTPIVDEMQLLVDSYNELISNLSDMTLSDTETGKEGVFTNDTFVKSLSRELSAMMTQFMNDDSLINYGIELSQDGRMSFKSSVLEAKIDADPDAVKRFFTGETDEDGNFTAGIFTQINESLDNYTGGRGLLSSYATALDTEAQKFADSLESATKTLDERYATMANRFAAYDAMIARINSQFSSIQMMIDQAAN